MPKENPNKGRMPGLSVGIRKLLWRHCYCEAVVPVCSNNHKGGSSPVPPPPLRLFNPPAVGSASLGWFLGSDGHLAVVKEETIIGMFMSSFLKVTSVA